MRLIAHGARDESVYVFDQGGEVRVMARPADLTGDVIDALSKPATRLDSDTLDDGTIVEQSIDLKPGQPGHAKAALSALPFVVHVADLEAGDLDERESDPIAE